MFRCPAIAKMMFLSVLFRWTLCAQSGGNTPSLSLGAASVETATPGGGADIASTSRIPQSIPCDHKRHGEIASAPIPVVNPTLGNGLAVAVLYMINFDTCTSGLTPTTFGIVGLRTSNGSWALGGGANLVFRADRYRITIGGGDGEFHYKFFGIGTDAGSNNISIAIAQKSTAFLFEPKIRVFRRWYIGPRYHNIKSTVHIDDQSSASSGTSRPPLPEADINLRTAALGLRVQNDTRDSSFYPRKGSFLDETLDFYEPAFGGRRSYRSSMLSYSRFLSFGDKNVLALHGSVCTTWGPTPFYDLCELGLSQDLRGYELGRFRDHRFLAAQAEFRRDLFWRVGAVAFMGAGEVGKTFSSFSTSNILPGGGLGIRFLISKQSHINLRADYALGKDSHAVYVGVTEAF